MSHIDSVIQTDQEIDQALRAILGFDNEFMFDFRLENGLKFNELQSRNYPTAPSTRYSAIWWTAFINQWYLFDQTLIKSGKLVRYKGDHGLSKAGLHYINLHDNRLFLEDYNTVMVRWYHEFMTSLAQLIHA